MGCICDRDHEADTERVEALAEAMDRSRSPFGILLRLEDLGWRLERDLT